MSRRARDRGDREDGKEGSSPPSATIGRGRYTDKGPTVGVYDGVMPTKITGDQVRRLVRREGAIVIDVLSEAEYAQEHIPGARNVPLKTLATQAVADLERDRPVIAYCHDDT